MPQYTFKFSYQVGDKIFDKVTGLSAEVIGVSYMNGRGIVTDKTFFHQEAVCVMFSSGATDVRLIEEIEPF